MYPEPKRLNMHGPDDDGRVHDDCSKCQASVRELVDMDLARVTINSQKEWINGLNRKLKRQAEHIAALREALQGLVAECEMAWCIDEEEDGPNPPLAAARVVLARLAADAPAALKESFQRGLADLEAGRFAEFETVEALIADLNDDAPATEVQG